MKVMIQMLISKMEAPASSKCPDQDLKDMDDL